MRSREGGTRAAEEAQRAVVAALEARREEVEAVCRARIDSDGAADDVVDAEYLDGLGASIRKAFEHGLAVLAASNGSAPETPAVLLVQARLAARNGLPFSVVQRRYRDCFDIFSEFLAEEVERHGSGGLGLLRRTHKNTKAAFNRLTDAIEAEYEREQSAAPSPDRQRLEVVKAHLAGMPVDTSELGYDFDSVHVALVGRGADVASAIRALATKLGCRSLVLPVDERAAWGWLGKGNGIDLDELQGLLATCWPASATLGIGEAGRGKDGSRRTYRQARKAFLLATRLPGRICRYGDDPLLVSIFDDEDLRAYLDDAYLTPLHEMRRRVEALETLHGYYAANRNGASAGHVLNVSRQTVSNRLREIDEKLGFVLADRATEIEVAVRLERLGGQSR